MNTIIFFKKSNPTEVEFPDEVIAYEKIGPCRLDIGDKVKMAFSQFLQRLDEGEQFFLASRKKEATVDWDADYFCVSCREECPYDSSWREHEALCVAKSESPEQGYEVWASEYHYFHTDCLDDVTSISVY